MKNSIIGGQLIYSLVDENWRVNEAKKKSVLIEIKNVGAYVSIYLGGYLVIGGEQSALDTLLKTLPTKDNYPFQLPFHAAFHTPLLEPISQKAFELLPQSIFQKPTIPLVDGQGHIWSPYSSDIEELYRYTLGHQVTNAYDFSTSITVSMKEFCPDKLVLLGPGNTLGGAIGQIMINNNWLDINSKKAFSSRQKKDPYLISMGMKDQRELVC